MKRTIEIRPRTPFLKLEVGADSFKLRVRLGNETAASVRRALRHLGDPATWQILEGKLAGSLPNYRLSKFQEALPEVYSREVVQAYLVDLERAVLVASGV